MTQPIFDQARADEVLNQIGHEIVSSPKYAEYDWVAISLVINLDEQRSQFGYVYTRDDWEARTPGPVTLGIAEELREVTQVPGKDPWKKALITIVRATGKIDIDFDYEGDRWIVSAAHPDLLAKELRPNGA
ncbi:hypothetical protein [Qipengyuania qiaonensis]|uniref:Uncharacterized protein n=1 Tax=Qipengyuania qiaonensis TaxID=2867240 RepID=A0ABS7J9T1_9SPHN|nr:hypothetical protein [Qipengyuania qiaonensis]MBX7482730.1 hypothetical protein [Qipengyuania qiaonensis]